MYHLYRWVYNKLPPKESAEMSAYIDCDTQFKYQTFTVKT